MVTSPRISWLFFRVARSLRPPRRMRPPTASPARIVLPARTENVFLILDEGFQSRQSMLPLIANVVEVRPELFERLRPERELALTSDAYAVHDTSAFQYSKMLGDRLSG